jgi:hypothetical protein
MSDNMSIDKKEPDKDNSDEESDISSPENDAGPSAPQEAQPAKRKGGRKPVCASFILFVPQLWVTVSL